MGRIKTESTPAKQSKPHLFQPGISGNPNGRPKGSRNKLTENILADLAAFYEKEGMALIERVRDENPGLLLQSLIKLVPREAHLNISGSTILDLSNDQRARIAESWILSKESVNEPIEVKAIRIDEQKPKAIEHDEPARVKRTKPAH